MSLPSSPADTSEEVVETRDDDVGEVGEAHPDVQEQPIVNAPED